MMLSSIQDLTTTTSSTSSTDTSTTATNQMDKNAFLKLLITQLANQDPLNPTDDTQFISQLAQFSSLEQMQQVSSSMDSITNTLKPFMGNQESFSAASWIGKAITAQDPNPPTDLNGNLLDPQTDDSGKAIVGSDGKPIAKNLTATVNSVQFTDKGPTLSITVSEKYLDNSSGQVKTHDVTKSIPLSGIISIS